MARRKLTEEEKRINREKRKAKKEAEHREHLLKRDLEDALEMKSGLPTPGRSYKVGDRVIRGNHDKVIVTEVLDNGRVYKVHQTNKRKKQHSDEFIIEHHDTYVNWVDIRPWPAGDDKDMFYKEPNLQIDVSQRNIASILLTWYRFGIDDQVDYQRGNVWSYGDKIALIDSIFRNIDIGKFVFIRRPFKHEGALYEVLDGKQRINALVEFYESKFKYKGKYFHEMCRRDRTHFQQYLIAWGSVHDFTGNTDIPEKYKYEYFLKLNTTGHIVDKSHLDYVRGLLNDHAET